MEIRRLKYGCLLALLFILSSCGASTSTQQLATSAQHTITALEKSLPDECKSPATLETIASIRAQVDLCSLNCDQRVAVYQERNRTLWVALIAVSMLLGYSILRKVI